MPRTCHCRAGGVRRLRGNDVTALGAAAADQGAGRVSAARLWHRRHVGQRGRAHALYRRVAVRRGLAASQPRRSLRHRALGRDEPRRRARPAGAGCCRTQRDAPRGPALVTRQGIRLRQRAASPRFASRNAPGRGGAFRRTRPGPEAADRAREQRLLPFLVAGRGARESLNNPIFAASRGRGGLDLKLDDIADRPGLLLSRDQ